MKNLFTIPLIILVISACSTYLSEDVWREFKDKSTHIHQELVRVKTEEQFQTKLKELKKNNKDLFKMDSSEEIVIKVKTRAEFFKSLEKFDNSIFAYSKLNSGGIICYTDGHIEYTLKDTTFETVLNEGKGSLQKIDQRN